MSLLHIIHIIVQQSLIITFIIFIISYFIFSIVFKTLINLKQPKKVYLKKTTRCTGRKTSL